MPLLGMLAAGAAGGLRDASNLQYKANLEMDREALRQEYYDRRASKKSEDANERAKNTALANEQKYERERADKLEASKLGHKQRLELEGFKQNKADARTDRRIAARGDGSGSGGKGLLSGKSTDKRQSNIGKIAADLLADKIATTPHEAYSMAAQKEAASIVNKDTASSMLSLEEKNKLIKDTAAQLYSGNAGGAPVAAPTVAKPEVSHSYRLDPKTGNLVIK